jgi:uncharacterized protein DUF5670
MRISFLFILTLLDLARPANWTKGPFRSRGTRATREERRPRARAGTSLVLWALGMFTSYTAGGLVHLLLVIAVVVIVFQFIAGRRSI